MLYVERFNNYSHMSCETSYVENDKNKLVNTIKIPPSTEASFLMVYLGREPCSGLRFFLDWLGSLTRLVPRYCRFPL